MNNDPLVSIVLPVHNGGKFLRQALDSLRNQTYPLIEIIVVNDGSTDDSLEIAREFSSARVQIISQGNEGIGASINVAVSHASGDLIALHTADDVSHRDRIATQVQQLKNGAADIVTCLPTIIDDGGSAIDQDLFYRFDGQPPFMAPDVALARLFVNGSFLCAPAACLPRHILQRIGPAHAGLMQLQDFEYWMRAAVLGCSFYVDRDPYLAFRWHAHNVSSAGNDARTWREMSLIYRDVVKTISNEQIISMAKIMSIESVAALRGAPREILVAMLCVNHRLSIVRQIGYERLMDLIRDDRGASLLKQHTGLTRRKTIDLVLKGH